MFVTFFSWVPIPQLRPVEFMLLRAQLLLIDRGFTDTVRTHGANALTLTSALVFGALDTLSLHAMSIHATAFRLVH